MTVNRNCGSSLQAINQAAQSIAADCEDVQIAGGVEHMHHIPMEAGFDPARASSIATARRRMNMGLTAENLALQYQISRKEQDEFALRSHQLAAQATDPAEFAARSCRPGAATKRAAQGHARGPVHPPRHQPGSPGRAEAGVHARGRHGDGRQLQPAERRGRGRC